MGVPKISKIPVIQKELPFHFVAWAGPKVMKITHNVALTFIQFLGAILDCELGIYCIALLYHFLLN